MKEYTVSLNMISDISLEEDQITATMKGKKVFISQRELKEGVLWSIESSSGKDASIQEQIKDLSGLFNYKKLDRTFGLFRKVYIDIAVYYDTYTCSVSLSNSIIETVTKFFPLADIEITCYPTDPTEA